MKPDTKIKQQPNSHLFHVSGLEAFIQVTLQVFILLILFTNTPTVDSILPPTSFESDQGTLGIDPITLLYISIPWSVLSCGFLHTKLIVLQKGLCQTTTKLVVLAWGLFATLRRVLSIVVMFVPSLGLLSLLHHWRWEQVPLRIRQEYYKRGFPITPEDKITFLGVNETVYWSDLDRWDYGDEPVAPPYSIYTLFSLKHTFMAGAVLLAVHFLMLLLIKLATSPDFRRGGHYTNKLLHLIENTNVATPFADWDEGHRSIEEYRMRFRSTIIEMVATFIINTIVTLIMMVPLWYTGI